ncbi:MAG: formate dehydrogenase accessory sulfurtransferase FdhD [Desulfuromonadales bacterium]|nr:formate dehydrogenase accessory sulfurtransferase FdhD [Desulfuromonadales bacterium]
MKQPSRILFSYQDSAFQATEGHVVQEFPVQLIVNGREIATLIGSSHDLRFLIAGFLRLQNFVQNISDFQMFSVCEDFGTANVRIKGELPERLKPVLTSGCGTGVSFSMPEVVTNLSAAGHELIQPGQIFSLMNQLSARAEQYKSHGGIHSAAVGRNGELLLYAEDLGRHNTLDRIAGEALFKNIDLGDTMLATSGRVSTEMVAKAALLGVRLIASRTSPTDMAIRLCQESGICLVGYVRGGKFTVYCHPEQIEPYTDCEKIEGVSAAILAGGTSSRMGTNKALLEVDGTPIITRIYQTLARLFHEVIIVTNSPEEYAFLPCRTVPDIFPGYGSIAGLHSALTHSSSERTFVTACDMPGLNPALIRLLCVADEGAVAIVPTNREGLREPLHAVYNRSVLPALEAAIRANDMSILNLLDKIRTTVVSQDQFKGVAGGEDSFRNLNTPEEYRRLTERN